MSNQFRPLTAEFLLNNDSCFDDLLVESAVASVPMSWVSGSGLKGKNVPSAISQATGMSLPDHLLSSAPNAPASSAGGDNSDDSVERTSRTTVTRSGRRARKSAIAVDTKTARPSRKKRKRPMSKREPHRDEFDTEETFSAAWAKWRDDRDQNNRSVKRSRQRAKQRRLQEQARNAGRPIPQFPEIDSDDETDIPAPNPAGIDAPLAQAGTGYAPDDGSALGLAMASNLHLLARHIQKPASLTEAERNRVTAIVSQLV